MKLLILVRPHKNAGKSLELSPGKNGSYQVLASSAGIHLQKNVKTQLLNSVSCGDTGDTVYTVRRKSVPLTWKSRMSGKQDIISSFEEVVVC